MKIKITRYEKLKNKIAQLESQQRKLVREREQKKTELEICQQIPFFEI